jgi:hypothetical protein
MNELLKNRDQVEGQRFATGGRIARSQARREKGQTIVVALIILGLLLILAFTFLAIINNSLKTATRMQNRSLASDLSEAGIRYAHSQLLNSELGADWRARPVSLQPVVGNADLTTDPDAYYLRPASNLPWPSNPRMRDMGGPDGLGPYTRIGYSNGRALVRVRYAPTDANILANSPQAALRTGAQRDYTIIESVGREGAVRLSDPTTLQSTGGVQFQNYGSTAQLERALAQMQTNDNQVAGSRKLRAFASIGIIESGIFVHNKDRVSRPVSLGVPSDLGAWGSNFRGDTTFDVGRNLPRIVGGVQTFMGLTLPGLGSMHVNGDLEVNGQLITNLNPLLGERVTVAGVISTKDQDSALIVRKSRNNGTNWVPEVLTALGPSQSSRNGLDTLNGSVLDGMSTTDSAGYTRDVGWKTPPSLLTKDPETGEIRYRVMSRESGAALSYTDGSGQTRVGNSGQFGHGRNVYVDNFADRQIGSDATARANAGGEESLVNDWLTPGGRNWKGAFYVPPGAFVQFRFDGFEITRRVSTEAPDQSYWKYPDGTLPTAPSPTIRYRIGIPPGKTVPYIVNSLTPNVNINAPTPNFAAGQPFGGVLFFEGNVRVRGVVPTDVQLTLVSMGTIYIEGSITKGVVGNNVTNANLPAYPQVAYGVRLNRPSRSMLMLAAKDYVAVNTTMFFGPGVGTELNPQTSAGNYDPIPISATTPPRFVADFPLDPSTGRPYAADYGWQDADGTVLPLPTRLVVTQTKGEGTSGAAFMSMDVLPAEREDGSVVPTSYYFPRTATSWYDTSLPQQPPLSIFSSNVAENLNITGNPTHSVLYGLGSEAYQRFSNSETVGFPLINDEPGNITVDNGTITTDVTPSFAPDSGNDLIVLKTHGSARRTDNEIVLRPNSAEGYPSDDYLLARAALMPNDVRIEAAIFAEDGSFFVIPGPWFNNNPNDTRKAYDDYRAANGGLDDPAARQAADRNRLDRFGTTPIAPFFGEPVDVRIQVIGAVSENMPPSMGQQAEWLRKWGWIPRNSGAMFHYGRNRPVLIPQSHILGTGFESIADPSSPQNYFVPNLTISYDPVLATGRVNGFPINMNFGNDPFDPNSPVIRWDEFGRPLPPMPRLPVSPTLAYFGEVK